MILPGAAPGLFGARSVRLSLGFDRATGAMAPGAPNRLGNPALRLRGEVLSLGRAGAEPPLGALDFHRAILRHGVVLLNDGCLLPRKRYGAFPIAFVRGTLRIGPVP